MGMMYSACEIHFICISHHCVNPLTCRSHLYFLMLLPYKTAGFKIAAGKSCPIAEQVLRWHLIFMANRSNSSRDVCLCLDIAIWKCIHVLKTKWSVIPKMLSGQSLEMSDMKSAPGGRRLADSV